tara:strand:+ start:338 stop:766 length:429 start_codon:yes stop_codon:yes gene_type:complete
MSPYEKQSNFKKNVLCESKKNSERIFQNNIQLIHQIFDTINISLLILISTLFFLSFDSQRKWSNTYKILSKTRAINNNLIDYISKIEEVYISELETLNIYRKTKPEDLIYLHKIKDKKESLFKKNLSNFIKGFRDSKYQTGY